MSNFQRDLDSISSWLTSHLLQLNSSKSKYMFFSHKSSHFDSFSLLSISHTSIERVSSFRYLGILLSPSLSWALHIAATCSKARKVILSKCCGCVALIMIHSRKFEEGPKVDAPFRTQTDFSHHPVALTRKIQRSPIVPFPASTL